MTLPLRSVFPGPGGGPVMVDVRVDDRWLATVELTDPAAWVRPKLPLGRQSGFRRYRPVDLRINRTVGPYILGVMTGEISLDGSSVESQKFVGIRPAMHPGWLRCSSFEYSRYAHSSRLAIRAPRRPRCTTNF